MAYDSNRDRSVLFGGFEHQTGMALADTWEWNGSMWTRISGFGATRCMLAALAFKGDSVALFGGVDPILPAAVASFGSTWTWDGKHWTLRQHFGPSPRYGHSMCYDSKRGRLVLFGGGADTPSGPVDFMDTWEHSEGP